MFATSDGSTKANLARLSLLVRPFLNCLSTSSGEAVWCVRGGDGDARASFDRRIKAYFLATSFLNFLIVHWSPERVRIESRPAQTWPSADGLT